MPSPRSKTPRLPKPAPALPPLKEINGADRSSPSPATPAPATNSKTSPSHQTHGGYTPITGPILTAHQLLRSRNIGKGSIGSFETAAAYVEYLKKLSTADLHRHAIDEAHIVAIDDRNALIKRLEAEWTGITAREATGGTPKGFPQRVPFTPEQLAAQAEIREKLLKRTS